MVSSMLQADVLDVAMLHAKDCGVEKDYSIVVANLKLYRLIFFERYIHDTPNLQTAKMIQKHFPLSETEASSVIVLFERFVSTMTYGNPDQIDLICPSCLLLALIRVDGKKVCSICAEEFEADAEAFDFTLPYGEVAAPVSAISYHKGGTSLSKNDRLKIINSYDVEIKDFQKENPAIAEKLLANNSKDCCILEGGVLYRLKDGYVRHATVESVFKPFDTHYRAQNLGTQTETAKADKKRLMTIALELCERYGLGNDQVFINTFGAEVSKNYEVSNSAGKKYSFRMRTIVETTFYYCLVKLQKRNLAVSVKPLLDVECGLINFLIAYRLLANAPIDNSPDALRSLEDTYLNCEV